MRHPLVQILQSWVLLAIGILLAAHIVPGIDYADGGTLVVVVILLSLLNVFLKPLLLVFTLPFIVLTLGLGVLLINGLLFLLVGRLVPGFEVAGFGSAFLGGLVVSLVSVLLNAFLTGGPTRPRVRARVRFSRQPPRRERKDRQDRDDDIIDI